MTTTTVHLNVTGMQCGGCESNVKTLLQALDGVSAVRASHKDNHVEIDYDPERVELDAIQKALNDAGFEVVS